MPNCRVNGLEIQQKKSSIVKHIFQKVDEGVSEWCEWSIRLVSGKEFRCLSISFRLVRMEQRLWTSLPCVFFIESFDGLYQRCFPCHDVRPKDPNMFWLNTNKSEIFQECDERESLPWPFFTGINISHILCSFKFWSLIYTKTIKFQ